MAESDVYCFQCTHPIGTPPKLNELEEGEVCPACRDRVLDQLPPIFHKPLALPVSVNAAEQEGASDEPQFSSELRLVEDDEDEGRPA